MPPKKPQGKKAKQGKGESVQIAHELDAIKRLLILQLITSGVQSTDVAKALGVSKSVVTGLVPARKVRKAPDKR